MCRGNVVLVANLSRYSGYVFLYWSDVKRNTAGSSRIVWSTERELQECTVWKRRTGHVHSHVVPHVECWHALMINLNTFIFWTFHHKLQNNAKLEKTNVTFLSGCVTVGVITKMFYQFWILERKSILAYVFTQERLAVRFDFMRERAQSTLEYVEGREKNLHYQFKNLSLNTCAESGFQSLVKVAFHLSNAKESGVC